MSLLDKFEEEGKEVYQATRAEWVEIMRDHETTWGLSQDDFEKNTKQEVEVYHKQEVYNAFKKGIVISGEVLKDYPEFNIMLNNENEKVETYNKLPLLTDLQLKAGEKVTVDNNKYTVVKLEEDGIIFRLYRTTKKGIKIFNNQRWDIVKGWS